MKLTVNGAQYTVAPDWQEETLLTVLREQLGLFGSRFSCGSGQCGLALCIWTAHRRTAA